MEKKHIYMCVMIFLISCSNQLPTSSTPEVVQILSQSDIAKVVLSRQELFNDTLVISMDLKNLKISQTTSTLSDPHKIELLVNITNVSPNSIILKKPITMGMSGDEGSDNDIMLIIKRKDNAPMSVEHTSNYPERLGVRNIPPLTLNEFILLQQNDNFSFSIEMRLPLVYLEGSPKSSNLPSGDYQIIAAYGNSDFGYILPVTKTPLATFSTIEEEFGWYFENTMVADLNAWVGLIKSDPVDFSVP